jgi:hypothetical protein
MKRETCYKLRTFNLTLGFEVLCHWHELHLLLPYTKLKHKLCFSKTGLSCSRKAHYMTGKVSFYSENHVNHNMYSVKVKLWSCILFTNISLVRIFSFNIRLGDFILVTGVTHTYIHTYLYICNHAYTCAHMYPHTYSIDPSVYHMACGYEISHNPMKTWLYTTRNPPKLGISPLWPILKFLSVC